MEGTSIAFRLLQLVIISLSVVIRGECIKVVTDKLLGETISGDLS